MTRLLEWEDAVHARFLAAKFLRERLSVGVCGVENKREQTRLPGGLPAREIKKTRGPGFYRGRTTRHATVPARDATSTPSRRPKPVPSMVPPPAPPPPPPPSPDQIQNAFGPHAFSPHVGAESRVEFQTRGARHAHILLWFIAEGPLGALSHDSDSDEPQPLLYMDELGTASPELLLALPCMDEPPPLVD